MSSWDSGEVFSKRFIWRLIFGRSLQCSHVVLGYQAECLDIIALFTLHQYTLFLTESTSLEIQTFLVFDYKYEMWFGVTPKRTRVTWVFAYCSGVKYYRGIDERIRS